MDRIKIMEEKWDYLIILDACRFDYFEQAWKRYFKEKEGELAKKISAGSSTLEWRDNSFREYYSDVVYISSNPYINSVKPILGFLGGKHFFKVYDVWADGWDYRRGTVLPETVTNTAIDVINRHEDKRIIIHYLQPHSPYLNLDITFQGFPDPVLNSENILTWRDKENNESKIKKKFLKILLRRFRKNGILGNNPEWFLRQFLLMKPKSPMDEVRRRYGEKGLKEAYKTNLEIVLNQVTVLLKHLNGNIILTSDHGEQLGENRCYSHASGSLSPYLIEIPWLIINKYDKSAGYSDSVVVGEKEEGIDENKQRDNQDKLVEKLRSLGYFD